MFKKLSFALFLIFSSIYLFAQVEFDQRDWGEILQDAENTNKLIFVYAYADWAYPSRWMDKNVLNNKEVGDLYNKNFICVNVNIDSPFGKDFRKNYKVKKVPSYVYLNYKEEEVYSRAGKLKLEDFLELGKGILRAF